MAKITGPNIKHALSHPKDAKKSITSRLKAAYGTFGKGKKVQGGTDKGKKSAFKAFKEGAKAKMNSKIKASADKKRTFKADADFKVGNIRKKCEGDKFKTDQDYSNAVKEVKKELNDPKVFKAVYKELKNEKGNVGIVMRIAKNEVDRDKAIAKEFPKMSEEDTKLL